MLALCLNWVLYDPSARHMLACSWNATFRNLLNSPISSRISGNVPKLFELGIKSIAKVKMFNYFPFMRKMTKYVRNMDLVSLGGDMRQACPIHHSKGWVGIETRQKKLTSNRKRVTIWHNILLGKISKIVYFKNRLF